MEPTHELTVYNDGEVGTDYIILKDGSKKYFPDLMSAIDGLWEEYPPAVGEDNQEENI